jgi:hypothetical protein
MRKQLIIAGVVLIPALSFGGISLATIGSGNVQNENHTANCIHISTVYQKPSCSPSVSPSPTSSLSPSPSIVPSPSSPTPSPTPQVKLPSVGGSGRSNP